MKSNAFRTLGRAAAITLAVIVVASPAASAREGTGRVAGNSMAPTVSDSGDVVAAVAKFHAALAGGDTAAVLGLLSDDVAILETGGVETKAQYRAGHMNGDMAYAKALPGVRTVVSVQVRGDVAWVTSTSVTQGEYRDRQVNSQGAELVVLSREGGAWKIRAIHWSSRARR